MKIPKYVQEAVKKQGLYIIGTSSKEGLPNLIYVKFLKVYNDNQILIANNKFFKTEKNLKENPRLSFVVLDKNTGKAYQLKGKAEIYNNGPIFEETIKWVEELRSSSTTYPKEAILLNIEEIYCGEEKIIN